MLDGRMMDFPLTLTHLVGRARAYFGKCEVVSRRADRSIHRTTYGEILPRAAKLACALERLGVKRGDRVATLCWNHSRHFEAYCAIPTMGAVLHTLNIRLTPDDLAYIAGHAEDQVVIADESLLPLLRQFRAKVPSIKHVIVIREGTGAQATDAEGFLDYEALLAPEKDDFPYPALDERSAAIICYTSGTTGRPKGVVYTHRSTVLHSLMISTSDVVGLGQCDTVLPVVPLFHANAWGLPYSCLAAGAKMIFPGPHLDAKSILELMADEKVTVAAGVPTIWLGILHVLDQAPRAYDLSSVRTMLIGGSAAPPSMIDGFRKRHGLDITHGWGMTEMNPLGSVARVKQHLVRGKDSDEVTLALKSTQGYPAAFVETRHTDDGGRVLPWDGTSMGELEVRGPWVAASYFRDEDPSRWTTDGWFKTGDVVTIDDEGYIRICDRSKDVIKSGGEWISSVELENAIMSHPAVLEAAVFAGTHEKWAERPIAAVVVKPGQTATKEDLAKHLEGKVAKWWLPDAYVFVEQVPRTSTGKFLKMKLRELYGDLLLKAKGPS